MVSRIRGNSGIVKPPLPAQPYHLIFVCVCVCALNIPTSSLCNSNAPPSPPQPRITSCLFKTREDPAHFLQRSIIGGRARRRPTTASAQTRRVRERRNYREKAGGGGWKRDGGKKKGSNFGSGSGTSLFWCGRLRHQHGLAPFKERGYWISPDRHPECKYNTQTHPSTSIPVRTLLRLRITQLPPLTLTRPTNPRTQPKPNPILSCEHQRKRPHSALYMCQLQKHTHIIQLCVLDVAILCPTITYVQSESKMAGSNKGKRWARLQRWRYGRSNLPRSDEGEGKEEEDLAEAGLQLCRSESNFKGNKNRSQSVQQHG